VAAPEVGKFDYAYIEFGREKPGISPLR
jgi:hypothetical protein